MCNVIDCYLPGDEVCVMPSHWSTARRNNKLLRHFLRFREIKRSYIKYCLLWLSSPIYSIFINFHKLYSITQLYSTETLVPVTHFNIIHKFKAIKRNGVQRDHNEYHKTFAIILCHISLQTNYNLKIIKDNYSIVILSCIY